MIPTHKQRLAETEQALQALGPDSNAAIDVDTLAEKALGVFASLRSMLALDDAGIAAMLATATDIARQRDERTAASIVERALARPASLELDDWLDAAPSSWSSNDDERKAFGLAVAETLEARRVDIRRLSDMLAFLVKDSPVSITSFDGNQWSRALGRAFGSLVPGSRPVRNRIDDPARRRAFVARIGFLIVLGEAVKLSRQDPDALARQLLEGGARLVEGGRDLRRLATPLAAAHVGARFDGPRGRRAVLEAHLADLEEGRIDLDAAARAAVRLLTNASNGQALKASVLPDPVAEELGRPSPADVEFERARAPGAAALALGWSAPPLATLDAIGALVPSVRDALLWAGMNSTRRTHRASRLLLPLSIETQFVQTQSGDWSCRVRAIPEQPAARASGGDPDAAELAAIARFHATLAGQAAGELNNPQADGTLSLLHAAWTQLLRVISARRAVTLLRRFPPSLRLDLPENAGLISVDESDADVEDDDQSAVLARLVAVPSQLTFWVQRRGRAAEIVGRTRPSLDALAVSLAEADTAQWWNDYASAEAVGLALTFELGANANDIERIAVLGDGGPDAGAHLAALAECCELTLLRHGAKTNAIGGGPRADLGHDSEGWLSALLESAEFEVAGMALPAPYGIDAAHGPIDGALVGSCYRALFGAADPEQISGLSTSRFSLAQMARQHLRPRGPVQPLAIGTQPYGLLPIDLPKGGIVGRTTLGVAAPGAEETRAEALARAMAKMVPQAHSGVTPEGLADALHQSHASQSYLIGYVLRLPGVILSGANGTGQSEFGYPGGIVHSYVDMQLPLLWEEGSAATDKADEIALASVRAKALADALREFLELSLDSRGRVTGRVALYLQDEIPPPNSLLCRLILSSLARLAREAGNGDDDKMLERVLDGLAVLIDPSRFSSLVGEQREAATAGRDLLNDVNVLVTHLDNADDPLRSLADLDAAFRGVLDAACYRLDTLFAAQALARLDTGSASPLAATIGAYGWVDAPAPAEASTPARLFQLAPGESQARVIALLSAGGHRTGLDSLSTRTCLRLADGLLEGRAAAEVLGAMLEEQVAILGPSNRAASVDDLRSAFPLAGSGGGHGPGLDGEQFFTPWGASDTRTQLLLKQAIAADFPEFWAAGLAVAARYAELTLAEGVHAVDIGRETSIGRLYGGAAGDSPPERFEVLTSDREASSITTTVLLALPDGPQPDDGPIAIGLGALCNWCLDPEGEALVFEVQLDSEQVQRRLLTLAELELEASDFVRISPAALETHVETVAGQGARITGGSGLRRHAVIRARVEFANATSSRAPEPDRYPPAISDEPERAEALAKRLDDEIEVLETLGSSALDDIDVALGAMGLRWGIGGAPLESGGPDRPSITALLAALRARRMSATERASSPRTAIMNMLGDSDLPAPFSRVVLADVPFELQEADDWLASISAVRSPLALADALLLSDPGALALHGSHADPFVTAESASEQDIDVRVVLAPAGSDLDAPVACAVLDRYAEGVGRTELDAAVALSHPEPPATPPQSLLLLPPGAWTEETMFELIEWLDTLGRARIATPEALRYLTAPQTTQLLGSRAPLGFDLRGEPS